MRKHLSKKSFNFDPTQNFVKCPKLVREAPRAIQKIKKNWAQKGPGPNFGPRVPACCPDLLAIYPVFYNTWALAGVGGMAEGLTNYARLFAICSSASETHPK